MSGREIGLCRDPDGLAFTTEDSLPRSARRVAGTVQVCLVEESVQEEGDGGSGEGSVQAPPPQGQSALYLPTLTWVTYPALSNQLRAFVPLRSCRSTDLLTLIFVHVLRKLTGRKGLA